MDPLTLWIVLGSIVLAAFVVVGVVATRRRAALQRARETRQLPGQAGRADGDGDGRRGAGSSAVDLEERPDAGTDEALVEAELVPVDRPDSRANRLARLRRRLAGSDSPLSRGLLALISRDRIDEDTWEAFEEVLITSDLGVGPTTELVDALRSRLRVDGVSDPARAREILRSELVRLVDPTLDRTVHADRGETPAVIMVVGVNGTGKTTTVGKLARVLVAEDKDVVLGAADTFRAAAADQLATWGDRVGVPTVRGARGPTRPASPSPRSRPGSSRRSTPCWSTPPGGCTPRPG